MERTEIISFWWELIQGENWPSVLSASICFSSNSEKLHTNLLRNMTGELSKRWLRTGSSSLPLLSTCLQIVILIVLLEKLVSSNDCWSLFPFLPSGKLHWSSISTGRKSSHIPVYCLLSSFSEIQIVVELVQILQFFIVRSSAFTLMSRLTLQSTSF